jgi:outer membrane protein assembly factor BamB
MKPVIGIVAALLVCAPQVGAQATREQRAVVVQPGVVVDAARGVAFVMNPEKGIDAIDIASGSTRWTIRAATKPLGLIGGLLVAQVQSARASNTLDLRVLDTEQNGTLVRSARMELPAQVRVSTQETIYGNFLTGTRVDNGNLIVSWEFIPHNMSGMPVPVDTIEALSVRRGALRFNPSTGAVTRLDTRNVIVPAGARAYKLAARERIQKDSSVQFASPDGAYVLASQRVADDRVWDKYLWTIYQRNGTRVGEHRTHAAFAPFAVQGSVLLYVTEPYQLRGEEPQPMKLRAVDLKTGREIWARQVGDPKFRGPFPP